LSLIESAEKLDEEQKNQFHGLVFRARCFVIFCHCHA